MKNFLNHLYFNELKRGIIEVMLYFEVFSYPMSREEVFRTVNQINTNQDQVNAEIDELINESIIYENGGFLMTRPKPEWAEERKIKNRMADQYIEKAYRMGRLIGYFPFVRAVMISGSLSKHWMTEDGDVDFFIVTEKRRLWIARTLLVLFKKIFLLNSHKYFCVNYFVDVDHLEIEEKNRFTASEIVTLLPVVNKPLYLEFLKANQWIRGIYPNFPVRDTSNTTPLKASLPKLIIEKMLSTRFGDWLDRSFLKMTLKHWNKKFGHMDKEEFEVAMKSRTYVSKHHPNAFQARVLEAMANNQVQFEASILKKMPMRS
ncbi:MAG: nucleotidyltransferase domain-containing protein [Bacteroidota bacterium]